MIKLIGGESMKTWKGYVVARFRAKHETNFTSIMKGRRNHSVLISFDSYRVLYNLGRRACM